MKSDFPGNMSVVIFFRSDHSRKHILGFCTVSKQKWPISEPIHPVLCLRNLINKRQVHSDWNGEVGGQTVHLTDNLISMNLLQMSCVITWAQKKFSLQPQKKNFEAVFIFFYFLKLGFRL
jgi:hypothetical protein